MNSSRTGSRFIHGIKLRNILSFGPTKQDLTLNPLNVVIGPNGSGKSNLIEIIGLLQAAPENLHEPIQQSGGVSNWVWRGEPNERFAEIEVDLSRALDQRAIYQLCFYEDNHQFRLHSESLCELDSRSNRGSVPYFESGSDWVRLLSEDTRNLDGRSQTTDIASRRKESAFSYIKGPKYPEVTQVSEQFNRVQIYRDWEFGPRASLRFPQSADLPSDVLIEDGKNLGLVLNHLKGDHPKSADRILHCLQQLDENIEAIDVSFDGGTVRFSLQERDLTIPATRLSDSTLRYMCLLCILCNPDPSPIICLESPELGLHPDILPTLAELLCEATERTQLIVTTHSDVLVDCFTDTPESIVICEKHDGQTHLNRLKPADMQHWLDEYSLGELWTKGELGGTRF